MGAESRVWKVKSGVWRVESGELKVESGEELRVENYDMLFLLTTIIPNKGNHNFQFSTFNFQLISFVFKRNLSQLLVSLHDFLLQILLISG